jgi:hypothetical protein
MQFPDNQFAPAINQIWAYCGDGISHLTLNPPAHEIKRAEWVNVKSVLISDGKLDGLTLGVEIKSAVCAGVVGLGCEEILDKKWMIVHSVLSSKTDRF